MLIRVPVIFLVGVVGCVLAQFPKEDVGALPQRAFALPPGRPGQFHRLQGVRALPQVQSVQGGQRLRRPSSLRSRPVPLQDKPEVPAFPGVRGPRPIPIASPEEISILQPSPQPSQAPQVRPVSEDNEEDDIAQAIANLGATSTLGHPNVSPILSTSATLPQKNIAPIQYRPSYPVPIVRPTSLPQQNITPVQYRPLKPVRLERPERPERPAEDSAPQEPETDVPQTPIRKLRPQPQSESYSRPQAFRQTARPQENNHVSREKKPVAQVIRRYREDNPDGSITWGFENDDGSYKEEVIGIDCITRGKYGYIDPDGMRREYTYETGIKCDEEEQQDKQDAFVDYQENKLVLPSGQTIDLSSMGKKQHRRPQFVYKN